jgi:hypothetical protein
MDYVIAGHKKINERYYLAVININTRYLFFIPFELNVTPNQAATKKVFEFIINILNENNQPMTNLRGDADPKFTKHTTNKTTDPNILTLGTQKFVARKNETKVVKYLSDNNINFYMSASKYTNKNRVLDRAIRTIRDLVGEDEMKMLVISIYKKQ